ncbi:MucR family transcriptional regulator [Methylobacterium sp. NMS12]|uniref:MucR family transcriptional regulator n=1 Tax=Methylobacterium sp. NMS12 TaxID=3079766 RepID=UPI003F880AF4
MDDATSTSTPDQVSFVELTADIVAAYISNNSVPASELPALLAAIHGAVSGLSSPAAPAAPKAERATPGQIRKSITHDALISFEDGKPYKTLKRHLTKLGLSPEQYREKWGLPRDYPLVAASYSETRSALAKSLGLGLVNPRKNAAAKAAAADETVAEAPKGTGRKKATETAGASAEKPTRARKPKAAAAE